jgi:hypothetical protein
MYELPSIYNAPPDVKKFFMFLLMFFETENTQTDNLMELLSIG